MLQLRASKLGPRAQRSFALCAVMTISYFTSFYVMGGLTKNPSVLRHRHRNTIAPLNDFDCAINWVRIPKTASTSVHDAFIAPLLNSKWFTTTYLASNTCVMGPGDCSVYWNTTTTASYEEQSFQISPYFGIGPRSDRSKISNKIGNLGRCFPNPKGLTKTFCIEYDARGSTMNFGPPSKLLRTTLSSALKLNETEKREKTISRVLSNENGAFYISPDISSHVGLDVSLYGWLLPPNPLVFSVFRDPLERLISSFHYGISYGADRPGDVRTCGILRKGKKKWRANVAEARKTFTISNDTSVYQSMFLEYLTRCPHATKNSYTQFLDPLTKNVDVALDNLEKHVIIGLQNDVQGTLQRWADITMKTCNDHPAYSTMKKTLAQSIAIHGRIRPKSTRSATVRDSVVLSSPDISDFDEELQNMIVSYTEEDELIYKRAVELFEDQRHLGLQMG
ncbi:hypothetical protein ACHAXR_012032 [Thalassiosira sp. AJA248-18]